MFVSTNNKNKKITSLLIELCSIDCNGIFYNILKPHFKMLIACLEWVSNSSNVSFYKIGEFLSYKVEFFIIIVMYSSYWPRYYVSNVYIFYFFIKYLLLSYWISLFLVVVVVVDDPFLVK